MKLKFGGGFTLVASSTGCSLDTAGVAPAPSTGNQVNPLDAFTIAYKYLVTFYPRWFTYYQGMNLPCNQLFGPDQISPDFRAVVAINDDTLYGSAYIGVKNRPQVWTCGWTPITSGVAYTLPRCRST